MRCGYYEAGRCRSCTELPTPYLEQLHAKEHHCRSVLSGRILVGMDQRADSTLGDVVEATAVEWLPTVTSRQSGFRNKAKMVVSGTVEEPILGILNPHLAGVDLTGCPLYPEELASSFPPIAAFITRTRLVPYDVKRRTGELKFVLVTWASHSHRLMVRFVLRTDESVVRIRRNLPELLASLPRADVVSVNLQPEHNAIVEGEREIVLSGHDMLEMELNGRLFYLPPRAFFQTNTEVAEALYRQAQVWAGELQPGVVLDLFCGIGAFALHCVGGERQVIGIESSSEAVAGARRSAERQGVAAESSGPPRRVPIQFFCRDASQVDLGEFKAEERRERDDTAQSHRSLAIVNPPRRGLGEELARALQESTFQWMIYSSCQVESLARDLRSMPGFTLRKARLLDMFPHTLHYEVIVLLERAGSPLNH